MITYLVIGGVVLLGIESLVPGIGIFGLLGIIALLGALYLYLGAGLLATMVVAVVAIIALIVGVWLIRKAPNSRLGKALTLTLESTKERGYSGSEERSDLLGKTGIAQSVLRPAGRVLFDQQPVDVVTDGEFYEPGTEVVVVEVTGGRIVVRKV
ncbi:NfeD family protein [Veillonella criceti]|uniref:NfeD-like C-terminal, partner-binding n=1 Tax=Veillonella criceti TaxID=103891 RepID=A0A380NP13_9FIRM|nr:NfeD family protein [Veillonella criceti]SUP44674.1 NfeD-like C-terminal, partner-binding [Veillonella criceti]